jgi:thiol:disulfide interchange protein
MVLALICFAPRTSAAAGERRAEITTTALDSSALRAGHKAMIAVRVEIKEGYHAQSHTPLDPNYRKFLVKMADVPGLKFGEPKYPPGQIEDFPAIGKLSVYTGTVTVYVPIEAAADVKLGPTDIAGTAGWQICNNKACFAPEKRKFSFTVQTVPADAEVKPNDPELFKGADAVQSAAPATQPVAKADIEHGSSGMFWQFLTAFLAGVLFNVVPCVLPVLPLKAIGFYEASQHSRARSLSFGAVFSLGLISTFAVFGVLIFGYHWIGFHQRPFDWGQLFTKWWFTAFIVTVLLLMAISTFGAFAVSVPRGLYSISPRHDTYLGNFEFGVLTALLSTPCTFGIFVGVLAWAITQPPGVGVGILVTVGAGMAAPYFILSALPEVARRFPRTGPWAEVVKQMMGFLLLLTAVYFARPFIGRVIHGETFWWLLFGIVCAAALYLLIRTVQFSKTIIPRLVGCAIAVLMVGGALKAALQLTARPFAWQPYSDAAVESARGSRVVLVEFTADWCGNCQYVEAHVLHNPTVVSAVRRHDVLMLKADVTRDDAPARPLLEKLNPAGSIPLTVIYAPGERQPIELAGIYSKDDLQRAIDSAARPKAVAASQ